MGLVCYSIPYTICPNTGFIVEGCSCPFCKQHRKEWLQNEYKTYGLFQNTCKHFWIMDLMFDWYHCVHCSVMRRDSKDIAIKPSVLEEIEYKQSRQFYFNDANIKSKKLNDGNINPKSKGFKHVDLSCLTLEGDGSRGN